MLADKAPLAPGGHLGVQMPGMARGHCGGDVIRNNVQIYGISKECIVAKYVMMQAMLMRMYSLLTGVRKKEEPVGFVLSLSALLIWGQLVYFDNEARQEVASMASSQSA